MIVWPKAVTEVQRKRPRGWYVRLYKLAPKKDYTPAEAALIAARNIDLSYQELETKAVYE